MSSDRKVRVIVFAGTTEGYEISRFLQKHKIETLSCVATEYGSHSLTEDSYLAVQSGRLTKDDMLGLFRETTPELVIDATHPYASAVTENIKEACREAEKEYVRVLRSEGRKNKNAVYVESIEAAVDYLSRTKGNILLTTGSKELAKYTTLPEYQERIYARVLSLPNVVADCSRLGFTGKHLVAMQGPFTMEMNRAMLLQYDCRYLVTKDTGSAGGFAEKLDAAFACNATAVIVGRPTRETGSSVKECKKMLIDRFHIENHPNIALVGIGMGEEKTLTIEAKQVIEKADLIIGARRMVNAAAHAGADVFYEYRSEKIAEYIQEHPEYENVVIALSGDVGFYSGARKLYQLLGEVRTICGISSVAYFMSKIGESWDDAVITSAHGLNPNLISLIKNNRKVFSILGTSDAVQVLARKLMYYGMEDVTIHIGEHLSYKEEAIYSKPAAKLVEYIVDPLSVICVVNESYVPEKSTHGIADAEFIRGKAPMTKEEIRAVSLAKLKLDRDSICYDIGAGTGSVAVEMALRCINGRVYAIEKKEDALDLIEANKQKFAVDHLEVVAGTAPEAMNDLPAPTHAFIGGSSGNMAEIVELLLSKNPNVQIVINCITLETISEVLEVTKKHEFLQSEIVTLSVGRSKSVGRYHMMMGENPIYVVSLRRQP